MTVVQLRCSGNFLVFSHCRNSRLTFNYTCILMLRVTRLLLRQVNKGSENCWYYGVIALAVQSIGPLSKLSEPNRNSLHSKTTVRVGI
jgi:hypothetical protein